MPFSELFFILADVINDSDSLLIDGLNIEGFVDHLAGNEIHSVLPKDEAVPCQKVLLPSANQFLDNPFLLRGDTFIKIVDLIHGSQESLEFSLRIIDHPSGDHKPGDPCRWKCFLEFEENPFHRAYQTTRAGSFFKCLLR